MVIDAKVAWRRKVRSGVFRNQGHVRQILEERHIDVGPWAVPILNHDAFSQRVEQEDIELTALSVGDLELPDDVALSEICITGIRRGYGLCQPQDAPHLRIDYIDQPDDESLLFAMNSLAGLSKMPSIFCVEKRNVLGARKGTQDTTFRRKHIFVFRVRK